MNKKVQQKTKTIHRIIFYGIPNQHCKQLDELTKKRMNRNVGLQKRHEWLLSSQKKKKEPPVYVIHKQR